MKFKDRIKAVLSLNDSPHKIAMSFSVGLFLGISPFLGAHTILAILFAWLFNFNRVVILTGVFVSNPWTIVPIYTFCTWVGCVILGTDFGIANIDWGNIGFRALLNEFRQALWPFFAGTIIIGIAAAFASYFIVKALVVRFRRLNKPATAGTSAESEGL